MNSLKEKDLIQFFELYSTHYLQDLRKNIKKISFNCYETTIEHKQYSVNGYGKSYNESFASGIANFIDKLLEDDKFHPSIKDCIKRFTNSSGNSPSSTEKIKTQPDAHH